MRIPCGTLFVVAMAMSSLRAATNGVAPLLLEDFDRFDSNCLSCLDSRAEVVQVASGTGRPLDGENHQIGFVDICDTPQSETIAAARDVGRRLYELRRQP